ncbi:MAG: hypothetical protein K9M54_10090 [Kiritimatiellales bacterium]|nr:hypothetical protein [Kiritimatiellales bacterium]MCF7863347.1 hypothetical protein [Kiritimatiellales bacterium]
MLQPAVEQPVKVGMPTNDFGWDTPVIKRLLSGEWPAKRNIIIGVFVPSIEKGKNILKQLRDSIPY